MNDPGPYYRPPGTGYGYGPRPRRIHWLPVVIGVIFVAVAALILLVLLYPASFGFSSPTYRFGTFGGVFALFFVLIVVFFIVRVAFWSTRASRYRGRRHDPDASGGYGPDRPAMIARMRYARGEITQQQYDQIMRDLGRRPGSP